MAGSGNFGNTEITWGEFKKVLEERGITDDMKIWYIDVSFPDKDLMVSLPDRIDGFCVH